MREQDVCSFPALSRPGPLSCPFSVVFFDGGAVRILVVRCVVVIMFVSVLAHASGDSAGIAPGTSAPLFRLPNQNAPQPSPFALGDQFKPDSQHAVVLSFFAAWCKPCRKELPFLQGVADSLRGQGVRLVAVSVDTVFGDEQRGMVSELQLTCPVVHDKFGIVARRYACGNALPYTVFIGRNGKVRASSVGYDTHKNTTILKETAALIGGAR